MSFRSNSDCMTGIEVSLSGVQAGISSEASNRVERLRRNIVACLVWSETTPPPWIRGGSIFKYLRETHFMILKPSEHYTHYLTAEKCWKKAKLLQIHVHDNLGRQCVISLRLKSLIAANCNLINMMQQRRDEILAKKAKLAELKRQRELRSREISSTRHSIGSPSDPSTIVSSRAENREELDKYISSILVSGDKKKSSSIGGIGSQVSKSSRPSSTGELSIEKLEQTTNTPSPNLSLATLNLSTAPLSIVYEFSPSPVKEVFSYSKAVQTTEEWTIQLSRQNKIQDESEEENVGTPLAKKRLSRRARDREEELREKIRLEIEEELKATRASKLDEPSQKVQNTAANFPSRSLTEEELEAITSSEDFMDFVERSSKIIERALDQEYDILADYARTGSDDINDDDDEFGNMRGKGRRRVKEIAQFYDEKWCKKRMISDINFSSKFPELLLAAYTKNPSASYEPDGLVQIWNMYLHERPEYIFHAQSDWTSPSLGYPNKINPSFKTPLTGSGHTHPIYSINIVGTQNANNIISCSTDGVVCGWTVDILAQPQEKLTLLTPPPSKNEDLAPTCMAFPQTDPTYFLVGTEEGTIFPCHRYDRAGAKAGVDQRVSYRGHAAPVMSVDFHPARGLVDLGDLVLSSSLDWSVKLWKVRAPAATSTTTVAGQGLSVDPILDLTREDVVYDAAWSPTKPGVFSIVDGAGNLEVWDITVDTEVPLAKVSPSTRKDSRSMMTKSLNKVAWEVTEGKRIATGGIDSCVTIFEVGSDLGGKENIRSEEWTNVKKQVARLESTNSNMIHNLDEI
ncbi:cytoplasmic dynein-like protein 1 intermediate chain 2 [Erysiphe pulchra]|uniref:Cytoplasmic dynein-like protein 1 intermediate chain 2 n=1 Tax=Erysiphe pulchra TaxID=225359 RepID=A0A2S4PRA7_9PEZI|nr:cytoplasmic dynein-like protein 1 intermediate chain 2 [Erysiphe pulchra]